MSVYALVWLCVLLLMFVGALCSIIFFRRSSRRRPKQDDLDTILFETKGEQ